MTKSRDHHEIIFRVHALKRMFERGISDIDVFHVINFGEIIMEYPKDTPYPTKLLKGSSSGKILHVVVAENYEDKKKIVVTVYEPDPNIWDPEFRRKIK